MKYKIAILFFFIITVFSCNNEDKYLELIKQENVQLNNELNNNFEIINTLYKRNENKYGRYWYGCKSIIKIRDSLLSNPTNIDNLKNSIDQLRKFSKGFIDDYEYKKFELLNLHFDIDNDIELTLFLNKFIIISNSIINKIIFQSYIKDFRFTDIKVEITTDKTTYRKGEEIISNIYIAAVDTTVKPIIEMSDGTIIDTFDRNGKGIFKTKKKKKGVYFIEGKYIYTHDYNTDGYQLIFPFKIKYVVK